MIYGYRCRECGAARDSTGRDDVQRCSCGGLSKRDYRQVQIGSSPFTPHFNHAVGQHVTSKREFEDALKRGSDANSERVGMDHNYAPVYPGDMASLEPKTDTQAIDDSRKGWQDKKGKRVKGAH